MQRLAHPHEDDVECGLAHLERVGQDADLTDDLARRQVAHEPHLAGQTERARHRAANLRGDTEGHPRSVWNIDALDRAAVIESEQELLCAVNRLLTMHQRRRRERKVRHQIGAELARQVGHRLDIGYAAAIHPAKELTGAEAFEAVRFEKRLERRAFELRQVDACLFFGHGICLVRWNLLDFRFYRTCRI